MGVSWDSCQPTGPYCIVPTEYIVMPLYPGPYHLNHVVTRGQLTRNHPRLYPGPLSNSCVIGP